MVILNVGAGKIKPLDFNTDKRHDSDTLVNLDNSYFNALSAKELEELNLHNKGNKTITGYGVGNNNTKEEYYCNCDIYEFLEKYKYQFDEIVIYRFLEHVPKVKILYFLYILSTCIKIGGKLDIIVPDYKKLAKRILNENVNSPNFESEDIITTFELLNEPYCPHASIWTSDRAKYFLELEGRFKINNIIEDFEFDGRDIYIRFEAERIK